MLCSRFVNGKSGDISLAEGAIRRFPRIMIPSAFAALLYWAVFHWNSLDGRVCHQVGFDFFFANSEQFIGRRVVRGCRLVKATVTLVSDSVTCF